MKAKLYQSISVLQKELNGVVISKFHLHERNVSIEERRFFSFRVSSTSLTVLKIYGFHKINFFQNFRLLKGHR